MLSLGKYPRIFRGCEAVVVGADRAIVAADSAVVVVVVTDRATSVADVASCSNTQPKTTSGMNHFSFILRLTPATQRDIHRIIIPVIK